MNTKDIFFKIAWISLAIVGLAIFIFGLIVAIWPGSNNPLYLRAIGMASMGMGLFGIMVTLIPYGCHERWAWFILWYYPIFWSAHLLGNLPPGQDHVHQIIFILLSLISLLVSIPEFFPRQAGRRG